jgi:replicative DNA helicase
MSSQDKRAAAREIRQAVRVPDDQPRPAADWEPVTPLGKYANLPAFPAESLSATGAAMVNAVAESTQTPADLAGIVYLGTLAACCGGRAVVEVQGGWREPLNLYAAPAMPPGSRKSAVFREMIAPLLDAERVMQEKAGGTIGQAAVLRDLAQEQARRALAAAAKAKPDDADDAKAEAISAAAAAEAMAVPAYPRLVADDVTPEALVSLLCEQAGRMAVMSAEGDLFDIMSGRYGRDGQVPNIGVFLKGHAGDLLLVDRKSREPERIESPALTIIVTIQPQVLRDIAQRPVLRGRGLLARVLYSLPRDLVGYRRVDVAEVPADVREAYAGQIKALALSLADWTDPAVLVLTPEARKLLSEYQEEIEPRLRAYTGDLADLRDWASKLCGATVRLAGLLHLAANLKTGYANPVNGDTMRNAIELGRYFTAHASAAFGEMITDPLVNDAHAVIEWCRRTETTEFSKRDLYNGIRSSRFQKSADLDAPVALLAEHGYIRIAAPSKTTNRGGRPSSPRFVIHPEIVNPPAQPAQPAQPE